MKRISVHQVPPQSQPVRLSDYIMGIFPTLPSRKSGKKAIKNGYVHINGRQGYTGDYLRGGEQITLFATPAEKQPKVVEQALEVVFEDDYLAVVVKPPGILVNGNRWLTVVNALPYNLQPSPLPDALARPLPVHRLDYPTSGLLLVGKTAKAVMELSQLFVDQKVKKTYYAITIGEMQASVGEVKSKIEDRLSHSIYEVIDRVASKRFQALNLVRLSPITGRRHQLRIHLSSLGHPILGDQTYGLTDKILLGKGLYLHAAALAFPHPLTGKQLQLTSKLPKKFGKIFPKVSSD